MTWDKGAPHSGSWCFHGKDGVAGSIPAGGSTKNQQARPGITPGLRHARSDPNRRLPTICQQVTKRGEVGTLRGDRLEGFAVWSAYSGCRAVGTSSLLFDLRSYRTLVHCCPRTIQVERRGVAAAVGRRLEGGEQRSGASWW